MALKTHFFRAAALIAAFTLVAVLAGCGETATEKQRKADGVNDENVASMNATKTLTNDWNKKNELWLLVINNKTLTSTQIYRKGSKITKSMEKYVDGFTDAADDLSPGKFKTYNQKIAELWQAQYRLMKAINEQLRYGDIRGANKSAIELQKLATRENEIRKQVQFMAPGEPKSDGG